MRFLSSAASAAVCTFVIALASPASADVEVKPDKYKPDLYVGAKEVRAPSKYTPSTPNGNQTSGSAASIDPIEFNAWGGIPCSAGPDGSSQCFGQPAVPPPDDPDVPELTRGRLLTAVRELTLPSLKVNIQPGGETLVNFDTIFYAQPQPFRRSITLLDYDIDVVATPTSYRWNHGDGTSHTTSSPGAAYPSKNVVHRYQKKAQGLRPSVDVTYGVRFRVDGGAWQDLGQTLTANGPAGQLEVREATAVLTTY